MGIFSNLFQNRVTTGEVISNPSDPYANFLGGGSTYTGKIVTEETALTYSAVWASVRILSEGVASLPLHLYKRLEKGKERANSHILYSLLFASPNPEMTAFNFRETLQGHLATWGNAYAEIEYDMAGRVKGLWPLRPDKVIKERNKETKQIQYRILIENEQMILPSERVLHIPGFGYDGLIGYSPIRLFRETIGTGMAVEEYGARFFGNGARPGGVIEHPNQASETVQKNLSDSWAKMHQGLSNAHRIAILEEGMTYKQIGIPPEDAQFLETRKFNVTEIARIYNVPPHKIGDLEKATFSNIEQQSIEFVVHTLRPWLLRWEQNLNLQLLRDSEKKNLYSEFLIDGLLRGDSKSRNESYAIGRQNGWLSANDIREMENMNPIPDGDKYVMNGNMIPIGAEPKGGENNAKNQQ